MSISYEEVKEDIKELVKMLEKIVENVTLPIKLKAEILSLISEMKVTYNIRLNDNTRCFLKVMGIEIVEENEKENEE